jgi:hypothetical protein
VRRTNVFVQGGEGGKSGRPAMVSAFGQLVRLCRRVLFVLALMVLLVPTGGAQTHAKTERIISGVVVTDKGDVVHEATVVVESISGSAETTTDAVGAFRLSVPDERATIRVTGEYISFTPHLLEASDYSYPLKLQIGYSVPLVHQSLVIAATAVNPIIDQRNESVYKNGLFARDDQIFDTLAAGINTGQHEGGGKSLEIRRLGFNLDHGGVNGGLKVLVDDVQQNQPSQGHGQGYLGGLKSLTPELVDDVDILNGPFSAEYGDFSGLGVVHIRLKETLPDVLMLRFQGGSFGAYRGYAGFSPSLENSDAFLAYEGSYTDGPFINPGRYHRNNVTANYTRPLNQKESLGFKLNIGANDFYSSGQLPLDLVNSGQLNRFGFVDPNDGGIVGLGTFGTYYKHELANNDILKVDGFLARSLFDLYSNFTFFLNDPVHGDEIQQHDSRLQQGINGQYLHPFRLLGNTALLTVGSNFHDTQINVGLFHTEDRHELSVTTSAHAHVTNTGAYVQQGIDLLHQRLHLDAGVRVDHFRFNVDDHLDAAHSGVQGSSIVQPKANISYTPFVRLPLSLYASYGRGISSQDARGVIQHPEQPKVATTDFYQVGSSHILKRVSFSTDVFLIDRSNEQVYIPDDGSFELKGPSRSYGWEAKTSMQLRSHLILNGGLTQVSNAFYWGQPRVYVDSAPHSVANAGLTLVGWHGANSSLRYRHISAYILDGADSQNPAKRATGLDVLDFSISKQIRHGLEFNVAIDNLNDKQYWETQNYFVSRVSNEPTAGFARVHATPAYPVGVTLGVTVHIGEK